MKRGNADRFKHKSYESPHWVNVEPEKASGADYFLIEAEQRALFLNSSLKDIAPDVEIPQNPFIGNLSEKNVP